MLRADPYVVDAQYPGQRPQDQPPQSTQPEFIPKPHKARCQSTDVLLHRARCLVTLSLLLATSRELYNAPVLLTSS